MEAMRYGCQSKITTVSRLLAQILLQLRLQQQFRQNHPGTRLFQPIREQFIPFQAIHFQSSFQQSQNAKQFYIIQSLTSLSLAS